MLSSTLVTLTAFHQHIWLDNSSWGLSLVNSLLTQRQSDCGVFTMLRVCP